jgi:hypothetical protein
VLVPPEDLDAVRRRLMTDTSGPVPFGWDDTLAEFGLVPETPLGVLRDLLLDNGRDEEAARLGKSAVQRLVAQNSKFDVAMIRALFWDFSQELEWDWERTDDTLIMGHLLASNHSTT